MNFFSKYFSSIDGPIMFLKVGKGELFFSKSKLELESEIFVDILDFSNLLCIRRLKALGGVHKKIPHTGNTRPSRMCVIKEYQYYTISLSRYHGWCQYHKSMSIGSKTIKKNVKKGQEWLTRS